MTAPTQPSALRPPTAFPLKGVLALLDVSVVINYIDRGSLSTAAPLFQSEMKLSPAPLGMLLSGVSRQGKSFFEGWSLCMRTEDRRHFKLYFEKNSSRAPTPQA